MPRLVAIFLLAASTLSVAGQRSAQPETTSSGPSVSNTQATLIIAGGVSVNNRVLTQTMNTVFKGDRIETASSGTARVSAPGLAVYLPAKSCLTYSGQQLELCNCGSIDVNASKPVSVTYRDRDLVVSSESNAAFTMSVADRDLQLVNRLGSTEVAKSGTILSRVAVGSRSFAGLGCVAGASTIPVNKGVAAAAAAPAIIATAVIKSSSQRPPLSSTTP